MTQIEGLLKRLKRASWEDRALFVVLWLGVLTGVAVLGFGLVVAWPGSLIMLTGASLLTVSLWWGLQ